MKSRINIKNGSSEKTKPNTLQITIRSNKLSKLNDSSHGLFKGVNNTQLNQSKLNNSQSIRPKDIPIFDRNNNIHITNQPVSTNVNNIQKINNPYNISKIYQSYNESDAYNLLVKLHKKYPQINPEKVVTSTDNPIRNNFPNKTNNEININECYNLAIILNLKRRVDRRLSMIHKLKDIGISKYVFYDAIDGSNDQYVIDKYNKYENYCKSNKIHKKIESNGALACSMSFFNCLHKCKTQGIKQIFYMEDDISFYDKFSNVTINNNILDNFDVIYLGYNSCYHRKTFTHYLNILPNNKSCGFFCGMFGLLISSRMIDFILSKYNIDYLINNNLTVDAFMNHIRFNHKFLKFYAYYKPLLLPDVTDSDIRKGRDDLYFLRSRGFKLSEYRYPYLAKEYKLIYQRCLNNKIVFNDEKQFHNYIYKTNLEMHDKSQLINNNKMTIPVSTNKSKHFVFIIPSYNNSKWFKLNLDSIFNQCYTNWNIIYVDDASTDDTFLIVNEYIKSNGFSNKCLTIKNNRRMIQSYSRYIAYQMCDDNDICILLDGDDWLLDSNVLKFLNEFYLKHGLEATYQSYKSYINGNIQTLKSFIPYSKQVLDNRLFRSSTWLAYHLRTCQAKFIKQISFFDFIDNLGNFITSSTDIVESSCFLELIDPSRHRSSGQYLMVYNRDNSSKYKNSYFNGDAIEKSYRSIIGKDISNRPKYIYKERKNNLYICNSSSLDLIYMLNKYHLEMENSHDLLVAPISNIDCYKNTTKLYKSIIQFNNYSDMSVNNICKSNAVKIISFIIYTSNTFNIDMIISNLSIARANFDDVEIIISGNDQIIDRIPDSCNMIVAQNKYDTPNKLLLNSIALSNGQWCVIIDENVKIDTDMLLNHLKKMENNIGFVSCPNQIIINDTNIVADFQLIRIFRKKALYSISKLPNILFDSIFDPLVDMLISEKYRSTFISDINILYIDNINKFNNIKDKYFNLKNKHQTLINSRKEIGLLLNKYYSYLGINHFHYYLNK